jgi:uncharacterized membrane protein
MKSVSKSLFFNRWFFLRSELDRMLTLSMIFSVLMVVMRIAYTGQSTFVWLIWNLFLAWLPYAITTWLNQKPALNGNRWKLAGIFLVWLLFIPNSFYILTDLFHLGTQNNVPLWYDLALIISFAWNGLLLGILSVRQMEKTLQPYLGSKHELFFIYPIMWLNALGVYIGRYLRFNSWDIITNPFDLITDILTMMWHPLQHKDVWGMVACFSVFMTLVYLTLKRISKAIH